MKTNVHIHSLLIFLLLLTGCQSGESNRTYQNDLETRWVYVEVKTDNGDTDYFYYLFGRMKARLFEDISNNTINEGFFLISEAKYYDDNGLIADYADDLYSGSLVFRIEEIKMLKLLNKQPVVGLGSDQPALQTAE
jgi:hypothetical protein